VRKCTGTDGARRRRTLQLTLAMLVGLVAGAAHAGGSIPLLDLRYLGRATTWTGCFESLDVEAVNPANTKGNILGFVGTPQNQRVEVEYEVEVSPSVPADVPLTVAIQIRGVRREGWEPVAAIANAKRVGSPHATRVQCELKGDLATWQFPLPPGGGGTYRVSVRIGGAKYFAGQVSRTITVAPESAEPLTREGWFAARLVDETTDRAFSAVQARGAEARPGLDPDFPAVTGSASGNAIQWKTEGVAPHFFGVQYSVEVAPADVGKAFAVGILLRYPVGEGRASITDPLGEPVAEVPVYATPGVRIVWIPVKFAQPGAHVVKFLDGGAGRTDTSVYSLCYLKAVTEQSSPLLKP
jgi:hypothetical protein